MSNVNEYYIEILRLVKQAGSDAVVFLIVCHGLLKRVCRQQAAIIVKDMIERQGYALAHREGDQPMESCILTSSSYVILSGKLDCSNNGHFPTSDTINTV